LPDERGDPVDLVGDRGDEQDRDSELLQPLREPRAVRVLDVAGDDLVADRQDRGRRHCGEYMKAVAALRELLERRAYECRLAPDRALESLDEAAEFVRERGLVTLTPDCALPSLFEACHEEAYDPTKTGFAQWPKTKYWWPIALEGRDDVVATKLHRGKTLLLSLGAARLADPICRA